jgi:transposase-like protein
METETTIGRKKHKRSTAAERAEVLEQFHRSGLTRIAFSRAHGVAPSTLSKWLTNAKREARASVPVLFKELRVGQVSTVGRATWAVEIVGPDGVLVRCQEALPLHDLSWLLRGR